MQTNGERWERWDFNQCNALLRIAYLKLSILSSKLWSTVSIVKPQDNGCKQHVNHREREQELSRNSESVSTRIAAVF